MLRLARNIQYRRLQITRDPKTKTTTIKGTKAEEPQYIASYNNNASVDQNQVTDSCPLRSRGIEPTKNDVLLLSQFIRKDGSILRIEQTKLAPESYQKVYSCIKMAQREGLLPNSEPEYDHHGAPIPFMNYKDARYQRGSRQREALLNNRQRKHEYWWLRVGHEVGDPIVERDAPRVEEQWPKRTHKLYKYKKEDPRVKRD